MQIQLHQFETIIPAEFRDRIQERPRQLKKGEHLVEAGAYVKDLFYVGSGYLRAYQLDYKGNDITLNFHGPGTFCTSYYSFYAHQPAIESLVAITDCELLVIDYESLMDLYRDNLELNILGRTIMEQVCIEKDFRIGKMLQCNGEERYRWFLETYPELVPVVQQQHISSFLGIKPETLSRIRRKMIS